MINLAALIDAAKRYQMNRRHRWPDGICCPESASRSVGR
jgi:hypothetical protein